MHKLYKPGNAPDGYNYEERCPHCDEAIPVVIDNDCFDYRATCPVCGKPMMLCGLCRMDVTDGFPLTGYNACGQKCYADLLEGKREV